MSGPGQWGSSARSGHSGTQVRYIMLPLHPLGVEAGRGGILITYVVEAGSSLVPASGKGKRHRGGTPDSIRPRPCSGAHTSAHCSPFRWQEFSHMATTTCKGG